MPTQTKEPMIRINLYVPTVMDAKLREVSGKTGAPLAEIVRRAIATYLLKPP